MCRLVHADLSEYNLLWHQKQVWMIDMAQAVEHEQPNSLHFLRKDCYNINNFFQRHLTVPTLSVLQLFTFIVDPALPACSLDENVCCCYSSFDSEWQLLTCCVI